MPEDLHDGDRVKFTVAHHSMNQTLREHEGEEGLVICTIPNPLRALVQFDRTDSAYGRWWIHHTRLERIAKKGDHDHVQPRR